MRTSLLFLSLLFIQHALATDTPYDTEKAPWPCLRGPYQTGHVPLDGIPLIDDASRAKLLWQSDQPIPHSHPVKRMSYWSGGYGGVIVAEGRVYLNYYTPPGRTTFHYTEADHKSPLANRRNPVMTDRTADDVVHCFDATTGKTLWRTVFSGQGHLSAESKNSPRHLTPCWWQGRIYAAGSAGLLYCLDAASGKEIWRAEHGPLRKRYANAKPKTRKPGGPGIGAGCPSVSGTVVAFGGGFCGMIDHSPICGFDIETGEVLWTVKTVGVGSPIPWHHKGKDYFTFGGRLVEARTGTVVWKSDHRIRFGAASTVAGDMIFAHKIRGAGRRDPDVLAGPCAFKLDPAGTELAWNTDLFESDGGPSGFNCSAVIYRNNRVYLPVVKSQAGSGRTRGVAIFEATSGKLITYSDTPLTVGYNAVAMGDRLITCYSRAELWRLRPDGVDKLGKLPVKTSNTYPALANGLMFIKGNGTDAKGRVDHRVLCYDLRK